MNFNAQAQRGRGAKVYALGLDVGGTKIAGGVVDLCSGRIVAKRTVPTQPERGGAAVLATALALAEALLAEARQQSLEITGIGVGVCELVDAWGNVTSAYTVKWQGLAVQAAFAQRLPTVVEADVRAAALAEAQYGAGQNADPFVYVTVGTGISSCLVQAGRPFAGARGNALVLATGALTVPDVTTGKNVHFVLEEYASGPALVARYYAATGADLHHGEDLLAAVEAGDPVAVDVVGSGGDALGMAVGWLVNVLDPAAIVVGGGLGAAAGLYWERFVISTRAHIWADASRELPIRQAQCGADAGLIQRLGFVEASNCVRDTRVPQVELRGLAGTLALNVIDVSAPVEILRRGQGWEAVKLAPNGRAAGPDHLLGIEHLVDCIQHGTPPVLSLAHALHVVEILEKAAESAQTGRTLAVESRF